MLSALENNSSDKRLEICESDGILPQVIFLDRLEQKKFIIIEIKEPIV